MEPLNVKDVFRINQLSKIPGGTVVTVTMKDGSKRKYNKIKDMGAYLRIVLCNTDVLSAKVGEEIFYPAF